MALLNAARTAQSPLVATFTFDHADTMVNKAGVTGDFSAVVAAQTFVVIPLPPGSVVIGGSVATTEAFTGATATNITIGDSGSANRYMALTSRQAVGISPLVHTGYVNETGLNIEMVFANTVGAATAGKITVTVQYVVVSRATEVQIA